jgi:hypothetical protein
VSYIRYLYACVQVPSSKNLRRHPTNLRIHSKNVRRHSKNLRRHSKNLRRHSKHLGRHSKLVLWFFFLCYIKLSQFGILKICQVLDDKTGLYVKQKLEFCWNFKSVEGLRSAGVPDLDFFEVLLASKSVAGTVQNCL